MALFHDNFLPSMLIDDVLWFYWISIRNFYLIVLSLEMNNQFERACCLALLTQNTEQSLEILDTASKAGIDFLC